MVQYCKLSGIKKFVTSNNVKDLFREFLCFGSLDDVSTVDRDVLKYTPARSRPRELDSQR